MSRFSFQNLGIDERSGAQLAWLAQNRLPPRALEAKRPEEHQLKLHARALNKTHASPLAGQYQNML
jgi:hypothetical protein